MNPSNFGLHRNVHPSFLDDPDNPIVSSNAFSPKNEENYNLSVDCEKIWLASKSFDYRVNILGKSSSGVWTIPRSEISRIGLPIHADALPDNDAHSLIDMSKIDKAARRDAARRLAAIANEGAFSRI
jgi:hypothetical protein